MCSRLLAVLAIALLRDVASHGMTTFQCPNGYYLSKFGSAFDGTERFYNFACSRFSSDMLVFDEECTTTETASTQNGDLYLSCGSDQYTVGVEMIENVAPGVNSWQLLCCHSESIKIRTGDCIDTKFINDYRRSSTFSSSAQIIRRWQAMAENGDRRWWLQLCPVDVNIKKPEKESDIRARRQVPWQWSRGRFPPVVEEYNPLFMEQEKREEIRRHRLFEENNRVLQYIPYSSSIDSQSTTVYKSRLEHLKDVAARRKFMTTPETSTTTTTTTTSTEELTQSTTAAARMPTSTRRTKTTTEKHTNALDYYDMYDDNFDKTKHNGPNGFLNGISDFLQNIQDGLSMAQIAFPQPGTKKTKQGTTTDAPAFKIDSSSDDDSLTIDMTAPNMKGRAFIQAGPMPDVPVEAKRRKPLPVPNIEGGTIENMLQMLGLCKGH
uniref:CVNH domain-containing protein n=1 Tax=Steinernema glaseri TaxID=37863 RepID=A0A1I8AR32_9BILA